MERSSVRSEQTPRPMKTQATIWVAAMIATTLGTAGCGSTPEDQRETMNSRMEKVQDEMEDAASAEDHEAWVSERNDVLKELRDLQVDIDENIARTEEKLADKDLKAKDRPEHEAMLVELKKEKAIVDDQTAAVESGTVDNWNVVKSDARRSMDDIRIWWDKQKDRVDASTDADKDGDGK